VDADGDAAGEVRVTKYIEFLRSKAVSAPDRGIPSVTAEALRGLLVPGQSAKPHQLDIAAWAIRERYSNAGDLVLDPFGGLMTVPYVAIKMGRRGCGIELNGQYFADGVGYCRAAEQQVRTPTLFDAIEMETRSEVA
jgi:hypothetical protein